MGAMLALLGATDSMFLASKIWTSGRSSGRRQLDDSLRFFRRNRLDLEQVHNLVDWRTQLAMLVEARQAGMVRYVGVTHYVESGFAGLESILRTEKVDFVQLPYSVGFRAAEKRLLPAAADTGTAVIVNLPFEGGNLFSSTRGRALPA